MKRTLLFMSFLLTLTCLNAQVIYDFETDATSTSFIYFGSPLDNQMTMIIDNPNPTDVNTSAKVSAYVKGIQAQTWAGGYASPQPTIDAIAGGMICVDVHMDHIGNLAVKLEQSTTGGSDWVTTQNNSVTGEWETLCFNLDDLAIEGDLMPATGHIYGQLVLFFDFGTMGTDAEVTSYFDNIRYEAPLNCETLINFETDSTTATFQYFGSSLEATLASTIANPNPSGVNTSDSVLLYTKAGDAMTWAGAFPTPQPIVDATTGGQICVDVHMDHIGNLGVKLEQSSTGGSNWITTVPNTVTGAWETLCFDLDANGLEDAMTPATGHIFGQLVIFPDFGTAGTGEDVITYIDNIVLKTSGSNVAEDVSFAVNMANYTEGFTTVYLSGAFNEWSGDANPMDDTDGDGIWTTTIPLTPGSYEYKFTLDNWTASEQFDGTDVCTNTTDDGNGNIFINREVSIAGAAILDTVCYESCYDCGQSVNITWNVNMSNETVSELGVYLAGGPFFGHAELPAMTDDDADGTYTITLNREIGFNTDYTFLNGICLPDWNCKENIAGQECAVAPFNDRNLPAVSTDTVISTCFGECSTDGTCSDAPDMYNVTFQVDMSNEVVSGNVYLAGLLINNWSADATPMDDTDGDNIYEATVSLPAGLVEFKFINDMAWEDLPNDDCTISDPSGEFINRLLILEPADTVVQAYLFGSCQVSTSTNNPIYDENLFEVRPNIVDGTTNVVWNSTEDIQLDIFNLQGQRMLTSKYHGADGSAVLDLSAFASGAYIIQMHTKQTISTEKIVVR